VAQTTASHRASLVLRGKRTKTTRPAAVTNHIMEWNRGASAMAPAMAAKVWCRTPKFQVSKGRKACSKLGKIWLTYHRQSANRQIAGPSEDESARDQRQQNWIGLLEVDKHGANETKAPS
jgi:hypothetical protein